MSEDGISDCFDEPSMEIQIKTLVGTTFDIKVSCTDTIGDIKRKIYRVEGIPIYQQNLIYNSKELQDTNRLCDAGIKTGSIIILVPSMRGGPISTRRLSIACDHQVVCKEFKELLENTRHEIGDKLAPGSKVSVLVFKEGDIINLLRVIENEDGSYVPYSEKPISPPSKPHRKDARSSHIFERLVEDNGMSSKIASLRRKMEDVNIRRQTKYRQNKSGRGLTSDLANQNEPSPSTSSSNNLNGHSDLNNNGSYTARRQLQLAEDAVFGEASGMTETIHQSYRLLAEGSNDLLENVDLKILERNGEEEIQSENEEIALKEKHRSKPNYRLPIKSKYSENKGLYSHTKQRYACIHKKAIDSSSGSDSSSTSLLTDQCSVLEDDVKLSPGISSRNRLHLTRLVLSESGDRPKSSPDSLELEKNSQEFWEIHEPASERLKHSTTCKLGILKRRQSLEYSGFDGLANTSNVKSDHHSNYNSDFELCSSNFYHHIPQLLSSTSSTPSSSAATTTATATSPSAIPPQYAPKEHYYFRNNPRSPLYGRKTKTGAGSKRDMNYEEASDTAERHFGARSYHKNHISGASSIQRLANDNSDSSSEKTVTSNSLEENNVNDLYGYYNFGCSTELFSDKSPVLPPTRYDSPCREQSIEDATLLLDQIIHKDKDILTTMVTTAAPSSSPPSQDPIKSNSNNNTRNVTSDTLPPVIKKRARCNECNRRLNITNIYDCRCGKIFCSQHRYSEVHLCSYDYKTEGRQLIHQQNPLIQAEKLNKI